jgi:transposase
MLFSNIYIVVVERTTKFKWIIYNNFSEKNKNKILNGAMNVLKKNSIQTMIQKTSKPTRWRKQY